MLDDRWLKPLDRENINEEKNTKISTKKEADNDHNRINIEESNKQRDQNCDKSRTIYKSTTQSPKNEQHTNKEELEKFSEFSRENIIDYQQKDKTLLKIHFLANNLQDGYFYDNGVLMRQFRTNGDHRSIVAPTQIRMRLLSLAHDSIFAGHLGISATKSSLMNHFTWPGISKDIHSFVKTCPICQKHAKRQPKLPLGKMEVITQPFNKVAIDIMGPFPTTTKNNSYALTLVDFSTRWPECIPLSNIKSETIAQTLFDIFCCLTIIS